MRHSALIVGSLSFWMAAGCSSTPTVELPPSTSADVSSKKLSPQSELVPDRPLNWSLSRTSTTKASSAKCKVVKESGLSLGKSVGGQ